MVITRKLAVSLNSKDFAIELIRRESLSTFLRFVQVVYKSKTGRDFVIRKHHRIIAAALFDVLTGKCKRLIINVAPRYGKTELAVKLFIAFGLALNSAAKFLHLSYSDNLARDNSSAVRDYVASEAYQKLFPHVQIKAGTDSQQKWYTKDGGGVYATSTAGQVTGFGAGQQAETEEQKQQAEQDQALNDFLRTLETAKAVGATNPKLWAGAPEYLQRIFENFFGAIIIDDPIKPEDAESEQVREKINTRFDTTIRSRVNSADTPIIVIMQRLHPEDLAGYLNKEEPGAWKIVKIPAWNEETDEVLDETKHTAEDFKRMKKRDPITLGRQYQQEDTVRGIFLYREFERYKQLPLGMGSFPVRALVDPKDIGTDYLAAVYYRVIKDHAYVIDIVYTQDAPEETELLVAQTVARLNVKLIRIEANNGGRYFERNAKAHAANLKHHSTTWEVYTQRDNKESRIINLASSVNNYFIFPEDAEDRWPEAMRSLKMYLSRGKNLHDDLQDCMTAIYEHENIRANKGLQRKQSTVRPNNKPTVTRR